MFTLRTTGLSESVSLRHLSTLRLALILAGLFLLIALAVAHFVHPAAIYLVLLPAFGLVISGSTGFCPLVFLLQALLPSADSQVEDNE